MLHLVVVAIITVLLHVLCGSLAGFWRLALEWEENETGVVSFKALDIGGEGFFGEVLATWVDGDTDGWCQLAWDASFLKWTISIISFVFRNVFDHIPSARRM